MTESRQPDVRFSPEITNRFEFGVLCARRGLLGTAMELGVHRGEFAGHFLSGWPGQRYVAVDHYLPTDDYPRPRHMDRTWAHACLARFANRLEWRETDTLAALRAEPPASVDFLYIDAGHRYWEVLQECHEGWERLRPGGIEAGHDFAWDLPQVMRAVREFVASVGVTAWLTQDEGTQWSWYVEKPTGASQ